MSLVLPVHPVYLKHFTVSVTPGYYIPYIPGKERKIESNRDSLPIHTAPTHPTPKGCNSLIMIIL